MRSGKLIDISKSSLISLKAELTRKQEEIKNVKEQESYIKLPPKPKPQIKTNAGVEKRNEKDVELTSEEIDLLKKSREVLEIKASIYDKCQRGEFVSEEGKSHYLVNFDRKSPEPISSQSYSVETPPASAVFKEIESNVGKESSSIDEDDGALVENYDFDPDEWVDYTDCLGRTRSCPRSDLPVMKDRDKSLASQLNVGKDNTKQQTSLEDSSLLGERELLSKDMHLEELRKKWEDQEKKLTNKPDVHYEDLLFNEARSHGVGYWAFSTDADKRASEQEMFKKVRAETEQRQKEAAALRRRREEQRQARLIAARQRQRARLGLPPISKEDLLEQEQSDLAGSSSEDIVNPPDLQEKGDDLQRKLLRAAHVRPWDVGKDGVKEPVMTQEEWIEKKRAERVEEFAPIPPSPPKQFKSFQIGEKQIPKHIQKEINPSTSSSYFSHAEVNKSFFPRNEAIYGETRRKGAEIPPPTELLTAQESSKKRKVTFEETAAAIEAGLKYLREEHEKSLNAPTKGTYNMI